MKKTRIVKQCRDGNKIYWIWRVLEPGGSYYQSSAAFPDHVKCKKDLIEKQGEYGAVQTLFLVSFKYEIDGQTREGILDMEWDYEDRASIKRAHEALALLIERKENLYLAYEKGEVEVKAWLGPRNHPLDSKYIFKREELFFTELPTDTSNGTYHPIMQA